MNALTHDELVSLVRSSTESVFATMLGQEVIAGNAYLDTVASPSSNGIVSFIGLAGAWMGTGSYLLQRVLRVQNRVTTLDVRNTAPWMTRCWTPWPNLRI